MELPVSTSAADLRVLSDGTLEVRFRSGSTLDVASAGEILDARERICGKGRYPVLVILPDDVHIDVEALSYDHYSGRGLDECTYAVAWEVGDGFSQRLLDIFYTYFPQEFPVKIFHGEKEAKEWLKAAHGAESF